MFVSDAWPAPAAYHRSFCEHWPKGGSEPLTIAPRTDFMAQSLVLSMDVCPGLGISPLRTNIRLSFSQADLGPRSAQELFFSVFLKSLKLFFRRFVLTASGTEIFWRVIFEILTFYGNIAFPLSPVLARPYPEMLSLSRRETCDRSSSSISKQLVRDGKT